MKLEGSLPYSQEPVIGFYHDKSIFTLRINIFFRGKIYNLQHNFYVTGNCVRSRMHSMRASVHKMHPVAAHRVWRPSNAGVNITSSVEKITLPNTVSDEI
jgi:hypothetical protein